MPPPTIRAARLARYRLDRLPSTDDSDDDDRIADYSHAPGYRRALWIVVLLNVGMGIAEIVAGLAAGSQALKADALDFLGDGSITFPGLMAIGWSHGWDMA